MRNITLFGLILVFLFGIPGSAMAYVCGDANADGVTNLGDAGFLISYIFYDGPVPEPIGSGDADCDCHTNLGDAGYIINYIFFDGPEPCCPQYTHYVNTILYTNSVYINAIDGSSPAPGLNISWDFNNITECPDTTSQRMYEWRLYGPFDDTAEIYYANIPEDCVYDPIGDSFICFSSADVLIIDSIPDYLQGLPQPLRRSKGPTFDTDPSDVWVEDTSTTLYDVFDGLGLTETSQYKFVFWVRSRFNQQIIDTTPAFSQFLVIDPQFERDVAVFDATSYEPASGRWFSDSLESSKTIFYNYVNIALDNLLGMETSGFDTISRIDSEDNTIVDYYYCANITYNYGMGVGMGHSVYPNIPSLIDILSHKVIIYFNDDADSGPLDNESQYDLLSYVYPGMDAGASAWLMSMNIFNQAWNIPSNTVYTSETFSSHFGIEGGRNEGWLYGSLYPVVPFCNQSTWNEQFIGAVSLNEAIFPDIDIDLDLLNERYAPLSENTFWFNIPQCPDPEPESHILAGLPEVGAAIRTSEAEAIYLYYSRLGHSSPYHGNVMGVSLDNGGARSTTMLFTPTATDSVQTQQMFISVLDWLFEGFNNPLKNAAANSSKISDRRRDLDLFLKSLKNASPERQKQLGIVTKPPILIPVD